MNKQETATLGGGCFWCVEAFFIALKGVESVKSGYMGGKTHNPSYKEICTGSTGHAEVIAVEFDPAVISYQNIISIFLTVHDPTTLNRQGNDKGTQYRSVVFYHSEEQKATAEAVIAQFEQDKIWDSPIVTEVSPAAVFYLAENYHQNYFALNGSQPYCSIVIAPKVVKFRNLYSQFLK
jgi:peptide-methionine (S)-S-oxide reductase